VSELKLAALGGGETAVDESLGRALEERLRGALLRPGDDAYEEARLLWNGMIDRRPALIARCESVEDVVASVAFARAGELLLAVRGGGHGVAGNATCDDGLVVDLSPMNDVTVDAERRLARVAGGARLGDVDRATQEHGLATPLGVVSETGVAGLTLSGGMGWLRRLHGLSCDNLVSAEVVTADARVVTASEDENPELLWALRGGGGNFGVVTSFEFRLHPVGPEVALAFVLYPGERAREVIEFYGRYMADAPDEVSPLCFVGRVPHADMFPAESHGAPYVALAGVHPGDPAEGERVLQPLRDLGDPIVDFSEPMAYVDAQRLLDEDYPNGWQYYWKSIELDRLGAEAIDLVVRHAEAAPSHHSTVDVWYHGGALSRVPPGATAFGDRALVLLGYEANFEDPGERDANVAWVRDSIEEVRPLSTGGTYLNFPGFFEEGDELLRDSYGAENYDRLVALKTQYDPTNLFRLNGNIRPAP
jgi:FAD/FMN-containing dehydrogenase